MESTSYEKIIELLRSQGKFYINLGLERIEKILDLLNNPHKKLKFIHVAGTNGKGSVCAILHRIFTDANFKTGLFTSPHIFEYTERIKINDEEISKDDFAKILNKINNLAIENNVHLTEFELLTALAFVYFAQNNCDIVILETGLGGRFDATNVIHSPMYSIITSLDFDHTERLGNTIEQIAMEKAGIIKDSKVIIQKDNKGFEYIKKIAGKKLITATNYQFDDFALKGLHQNNNLGLALTAVNQILPNIKINDLIISLKNVKHKFRFEINEEKKLIIDAAHNPAGIEALRDNLDFYFKGENFRFIFGCLKNKDYKQMLKTLLKEGDEIYFYKYTNQNSTNIDELQKYCPIKSSIYENQNFDKSKWTVICGSIYMLSDLEILK